MKKKTRLEIEFRYIAPVFLIAMALIILSFQIWINIKTKGPKTQVDLKELQMVEIVNEYFLQKIIENDTKNKNRDANNHFTQYLGTYCWRMFSDSILLNRTFQRLGLKDRKIQLKRFWNNNWLLFEGSPRLDNPDDKYWNEKVKSLYKEEERFVESYSFFYPLSDAKEEKYGVTNYSSQVTISKIEELANSGSLSATLSSSNLKKQSELLLSLLKERDVLLAEIEIIQTNKSIITTVLLIVFLLVYPIRIFIMSLLWFIPRFVRALPTLKQALRLIAEIIYSLTMAFFKWIKELIARLKMKSLKMSQPIIIGVSIIVFALIAVAFSETHYYLNIPTQPTIEVSKEKFQQLISNDQEDDFILTKKTVDYNYIYGAIGGGAILIILTGFFRNKR